MNFLELLGIQKKNFDNDSDLEYQIKERYMAWMQYLSVNSNKEECEEQSKKINAIYSFLMESKYRQSYLIFFSQIDSYFDFTKDSGSDIEIKITEIKKILDKQSEMDKAIKAFNNVLVDCRPTQEGLNKLRSILAKKTVEWSMLSNKAQEFYFSLLKERERYILLILKRAHEVLEQQNFSFAQKNFLPQLISQFLNKNYSNVPPELFKNIEDEKEELICAYTDLLYQKNLLFIKLYKTAFNMIKDQKIICNQRDLTLINNVLQQIEEQNYNVIPSTLFLSAVDESQKQFLIGAYYESLQNRKNFLEKLYYTVWQALDQQNIPCSKQGITMLDNMLFRLFNGDYSFLPQSLLQLFKKTNPTQIIHAYYDLLSQKKSYIESIVQGVQEILKKKNLYCTEEGIARLKDIGNQINQGNYNSLFQELEQPVEEPLKTDLISIYNELIKEYIDYYDFIWHHAENIINQQDFQGNPQTLNYIIDTITKISQMDYSSLPQYLFSEISENYHQDLIFVYSELLQKKKVSIELSLDQISDIESPYPEETEEEGTNYNFMF